MTARACSNCNWWRPAFDNGADIGTCRAHPPAVDQGATVWPATDADEWCGAFRASEVFIRHGAVQQPSLEAANA